MTDVPLTASVKSANTAERNHTTSQAIDVAVLAGLAVAVMGWLIFSISVPPLADYPYNLALFFIHARTAVDQFLAQYYVPFWRFQPNLGLDALAYVLMPFLDIHTVGKITVWVSFASLLAGGIAVHRALHGYWSLVPLMAGVLVLNRYFTSGFLEFLLSLGWAMIGFAAWIALRERPVARLVVGTLFSFGVYLGHLYAFGVYAVCVGGYEFTYLLRDLRFWHWVRTRGALAVAQAVPSICVFLFVSPTVGGIGSTQWRPLKDKLAAPIVLLPGYDLPLELFLLAVPCVALAIAWWFGRAKLRREFFLAIAIFAALYMIMPDILFSSYAADRRMVVPVAMLAMLSFDWKARTAQARLLQLALVLGVLGAQIAHVAIEWRKSDPLLVGLMRLTTMVEQGAKVGGVTIVRSDQYLTFPPLHEFPSMFVPQRSAFVPNLYAYPTDAAAPVRYTPAYVDKTHRPPVIYVPADGTDAEIQQMLDRYLDRMDKIGIGYFLVIDEAHAPIRLPKSFTPIGSAGDGKARLYRIDRPKGS
ncbi:MAG: hypothetical protein IT563_21980 [Alphaproteobacteria bacterium]|nr:hypothetical protein [Alphaproteobacteria bacterium]